MDIVEKYQAFYPPPPHPPPDVVCEEKQVGCNTDHISLANHHLKSRHISHEQRLQVRKKQSCKIHFISRLVKRRYYNVNVNACLSVCLSVRPQYSSTFCDSPKVMKKKKTTGQRFLWEKYFLLLCNGSSSNEIPILDMFNPYLSNATMVSWDLW